jgi:hypothetical protein
MNRLFICQMLRSKRYTTAKKLILGGEIKTFSELLDILDKTPLARAIKISPARLNKLIDNPALFLFQDAYSIADLIGVDGQSIVDLIHADHLQKGAKRK